MKMEFEIKRPWDQVLSSMSEEKRNEFVNRAVFVLASIENGHGGD
jgi:hypothetical protein